MGDNGVVPLAAITSGMTTGTALPATTTYPPGATPPIAGAPPLPTVFVYSAAEWPPSNTVPDTTSPEVKEWLKELDGVEIPNWAPTVDGSCANDPVAVSEAEKRRWWTCGKYTGVSDILVCPDKLTWGLTFDDGPSDTSKPSKPLKLLKYLGEKDLSATFFVVGSRVVEQPTILIEEYMQGHEIGVHTWSHSPLTSLTNEQIVAELGWTREAIRRVIGVSPLTMRPPYGDLDDRVRAISLAMGMIPVGWTSGPSGPMDTNDWKVAGGLATGPEAFATFSTILEQASAMDTGFLVLEHDIYEITVDLATGYFLPSAQTHNPPFTVSTAGECAKIPPTDLYAETTTNTTFPRTSSSSGKASNSTSSSSKTSSSTPSNSKSSGSSSNSTSAASVASNSSAAVGSILPGLSVLATVVLAIVPTLL
ncbi:hypothetical protein OF83DRAFT_1201766 [Amylostereum chailletii]|nr:hypothetical protein OF83DRAFT_1201766 [Amylostereum chailletii]